MVPPNKKMPLFCSVRRSFIWCILLALFSFISCQYERPPLERCNRDFPTEGEQCIFRLYKRVDGFINLDENTTRFSCDTITTNRTTAELGLRIFNADTLACDESVPPFPPASTVLTSKGHVIYRADGFGHFKGDFQIINKPANPKVLFEGTIELIAKIGNHLSFDNPQCNDRCIVDRHLEGWLTGKGVGDLSDYLIRATITINRNAPGNFPEQGTILPSSIIAGMIVQAS